MTPLTAIVIYGCICLLAGFVAGVVTVGLRRGKR